jgi:peptidoglycan/LPS O-acetylase OafA/YrhL
VLALAGALLFTPAFFFQLENTPFIYTAGLTLFYLGGSALIVGVLLSAVPVNAVTRFFGFLGAHSYSVYLWHMPVILYGIPFLERRAGGKFPFYIQTSLCILGSFAFGVVMAKTIENPALTLRERLFPSQSGMDHPVVKDPAAIQTAS